MKRAHNQNGEVDVATPPALPNATVLTLHARLSGLYKDLASLSIGGYSGGIQPLNRQKGDRGREARKRAGEFLLRQMSAAGNEAR